MIFFLLFFFSSVIFFIYDIYLLTIFYIVAFIYYIKNTKLKSMKRKIYKDPNNSKYSKLQKKRNYTNHNEASTSTNVNFQNNQFNKSNTEIITGLRARSIQLFSSYNTGKETSNSSSDNYSLPSIQESNFFILFFFFFTIINLKKTSY